VPEKVLRQTFKAILVARDNELQKLQRLKGEQSVLPASQRVSNIAGKDEDIWRQALYLGGKVGEQLIVLRCTVGMKVGGCRDLHNVC
jgi:hypothetical protein